MNEIKAKELKIKPISSSDANRITKQLHYSGKVVNNSQLHFGIFHDDRCGGVLQFGPSLDKSKIVGLVENTSFNGFLELNRMALAEWLPKNSESRSMAVCFRLIKRQYPHIEWLVSFADGCQSGHGTIYQATGWWLTGIVKNKNLARLPDGSALHKMTLESNPNKPRPEAGGRSYYQVTGGRYNWRAYVDEVGGEILTGYQFRYIHPLKEDVRERLTVPILPYSKIDELNGRMYRGLAC